MLEIKLFIHESKEHPVTDAQIQSLIGLARKYETTVRAAQGSLGLPTSYIGFDLVDRIGMQVLMGGIDPEGTIST